VVMGVTLGIGLVCLRYLLPRLKPAIEEQEAVEAAAA